MPGNAAICTGATVTSVTTVALPAARSSGEWNVWTHRRPVNRILRAVFVGVARFYPDPWRFIDSSRKECFFAMASSSLSQTPCTELFVVHSATLR